MLENHSTGQFGIIHIPSPPNPNLAHLRLVLKGVPGVPGVLVVAPLTEPLLLIPPFAVGLAPGTEGREAFSRCNVFIGNFVLTETDKERARSVK